MSTYTKYIGKIIGVSEWAPGYKITKNDGSMTDTGCDESFFEIGPDQFVVFPYWHDQEFPVIMTAAEVLALIAVR